MYFTSARELCCTICLVLLLVTSSEGRGVRQGFKYTLHTTAMTWNEALSVCEASSSTLFTPMTLQKHTDFKQIYDYWSIEETSILEMWMGLYNDDPSNDNFIWVDCCAEERLWENWAYYEPNLLVMERCVRLYGGKEWKTKSCDITFPFVCESKTDGCTFDIIGNASLKRNNNIVNVGTQSLVQCENYCLSLRSSADEECIAFTYTETNSCMIEKGVQVYVTSQPPTDAIKGYNTYVKRCYKYLIQKNSGGVQNTDKIPNHSCSLRLTCDNPLFLPSPSESSSIKLSTLYQISPSTSLQASETISLSLVGTQTPTPAQHTSTDSNVPLSPVNTAPSTVVPVSTSYSSSVELGVKAFTSVLMDQSASVVDTISTVDLYTIQPSSRNDDMSFTSATDTALTQNPYTSVLETATETSYTAATRTPNTADTEASTTVITKTPYAPETDRSTTALTHVPDHVVTQISSSAVTQTTYTGVTHSTDTTTSVSADNKVASPAHALCSCFCVRKGKQSTQIYTRHLQINKQELSSFRRRRTSAVDTRPSARAIGSVLGMGILLSVGMLIVILDINVIMQLFSGKTCRHRQHK